MIFRDLKNYYEDEMYHAIGIEMFNILIHLGFLFLIILTIVLLIIHDIKTTQKLNEHEFIVSSDSVDEFKTILHSIKLKGIKVFDDRVVSKKAKELEFKIKFYDVPYKVAFNLKEEFLKQEDAETHIVRTVTMWVFVAILDIGLQLYRIN